MVKLVITLVKYAPQACLNWRRRSTVGWNIDNVILDFSGGILSLAQLLIDGGCSSWTKVIGDPVKFGLGFASIVFDSIFLVQHYWLYAGAQSAAGELGAPMLISQPTPPPKAADGGPSE